MPERRGRPRPSRGDPRGGSHDDPPTPFVLRRAEADDATGSAAVHHGSWVETYDDLLPPSHWLSDTLERRTETWRGWLSGDGGVTVAQVRGKVVGVAYAGAGRSVGDRPSVRARELYLLYVLAAHHGSGVGQVLLDAVLPSLPAQLRGAEHIPRARRFYERNGFVSDGARDVDEELGLAAVRLVR